MTNQKQMAKKGLNNYDDVLRTLADNVKRLRLEAGLTQQELSVRSKLFHTYIGRLERRVYHPGLESLTKIANALGVTVIELLTPARSRR